MGFGYAFTPNVHFTLGTKLRFVEQLVDPGDSGITTEMTVGLAFLFGAR